jgi:hypothetical protein
MPCAAHWRRDACSGFPKLKDWSPLKIGGWYDTMTDASFETASENTDVVRLHEVMIRLSFVKIYEKKTYSIVRSTRFFVDL